MERHLFGLGAAGCVEAVPKDRRRFALLAKAAHRHCREGDLPRTYRAGQNWVARPTLWSLVTNPVGVRVGCPTLQEQAKPGPVGWEIVAFASVKQRSGTFLILGESAQMALRHFFCGEKRIFAQYRQTHHEGSAERACFGLTSIGALQLAVGSVYMA
jgi:hypothetical protein